MLAPNQMESNAEKAHVRDEVYAPPPVSTRFIHPMASTTSLADCRTSEANQAGEKDLSVLSEADEYVEEFFGQLWAIPKLEVARVPHQVM
jgi:hypothetical protein